MPGKKQLVDGKSEEKRKEIELKYPENFNFYH